MTVKLPFNRFVTFVKPYLDSAAGLIAAALVAKVNVLGLPHLDQANTQTYIAAAMTYGLTHGGLALGNLSWIKGHHIELAAGPAVDDQEPADVTGDL